MSTNIAIEDKKKQQLTLQDVRNHARLTGLSFAAIARKIGKEHSHVWRVLKEGRKSAAVWKAIMALPLDSELVNYLREPSINTHANIIPDNRQDCNGYLQKKIAKQKG